MKVKTNSSVELVHGGNTFKQGDDIELVFEIKEDGQLLDLTGATVEFLLSNGKALVIEREARVENGQIIIEFTNEDSITGHGQMLLEIHVTKEGITRKFPSDGFQQIRITPSLDDLEKGGVPYLTFEVFVEEYHKIVADTKEEMKADVTALQGDVGTLSRKQKNVRVDVIEDFGALGTGTHPLSERFSTLAEAQAVFPIATSLTDETDWCAIQTALDYSAVNNTTVYFPNGNYRINKPLVMYGANNETTSGTSLLGESFEGVKIIKQKSDVLSSSYPFNTNAVLIVVNENYRGKTQNNTLNDTTENVDKVFIENIMLEGAKDTSGNRLVDYGIFMPINTFSSRFTSLRLREFKEAGVKNKGNFFLNRFQQVRSERAKIGFDLGEVGKINTSIHMNGCYAVSCETGYKVRGIYNELDCCCGDAITGVVFDLTGFHGTVNTAGAESQYAKVLFQLNESDVVFNGAYTFGNFDDVEHIHVKASSNSRTVFNGGALMVDWTEAGREVLGKLIQSSNNSSVSFNDTVIASKYRSNNSYGDTKVYGTMKNQRGGVNFRDYGTTVQPFIGHDAKDINGGYVDDSATNPRILGNAIFFGHGKDPQTLIDGQTTRWNSRTNIGDIMLTRNILGTGGVGWVNWLDRSRDLSFKGTITESITGQITLSDVMLSDYDKYGVYAPTLRPIKSSSGGSGTISSIDYTNKKISIASMTGTWNVGDTVFIPKSGANTDVVTAKIPIIHSGTTQFRPKDNLVKGQTYYDETLGKPIWWDGTKWSDPIKDRFPFKEEYGADVPTTGKWNKADKVYNSEPFAGGYIGWICVQSGEFGTATEPEFRPFGLISE